MSKKRIVSIIMLVVLAAGIALAVYGATGVGIYDNAAAMLGGDKKAAIGYIQDPSTLKELSTLEKLGADFGDRQPKMSGSYDAFNVPREYRVTGGGKAIAELFRPELEKQIAAGGPITITDKRVIRYFMTIPEASGLVMQAGAMAKRGELFVLDMGKPVRILDLAENMVRLSGLVPYRDIDIVETGLRPGEKLYEELLIKTETLDKTENNMIFIEKDTPYTRKEVDEKLDILRAAVDAHQGEIGAIAVTEAMKQVVPTFHAPETVNKVAAKAAEMQMVHSEN